MPCAVKLYAYIFIANILTVVIVVRWATPFGFMASIAFGLAFAYLTRSLVVWAKGAVKA